MKIEELLHKAVEKLQARGCPFALCGGLVASIYRTDKRATDDVDFVIAAGTSSCQVASDIITGLGFEVGVIRAADLEGGPKFAIKKKNTAQCIVVGRIPSDTNAVGLDILLPGLSWVELAVERAQSNLIDFGFAIIPCITVEDCIVSKLMAFKHKSTRFEDLADIRAIFEAKHELDLPYLIGRMQDFNLPIPEVLWDYAHYLLVRVSKKLRKKRKS